MKFQLWYREGVGEPWNGFFQAFTERVGAGMFETILEVQQYVKHWNHFRSVWEIESTPDPRPFDRADYTSDFIEECKRHIRRYRNELRSIDEQIHHLEQRQAATDSELARWEANLEQEYKDIRADEAVGQ